jgi:hypothetical protein
MGTNYTEYQSVELPPIISQNDSVSSRGRVGSITSRRSFWMGVWIAAFALLVLGTLALMLFSSNTSMTTTGESLYSYVARLGSSHDTTHSQHYHHDGKDFTKIVVIDKHSRGNGNKHKQDHNGNESDKNETDNDKKSKTEYDWKQWVPNGKKTTNHHDGDKNKHDGKSSKGDDDDDDDDDKGGKKEKSEYDWKKWVPDDKKKSSHDDGSKDGKQKHDKNIDAHEDKQQEKDKNAKTKVSDEKKKNAPEGKNEEQKNKHDGTKSNQNQTDEKQEGTPFSKRAGEIYGSIKVNKTCTEAYNTPLFLNFGQLFNSLVNMPATQLTKHTYSFDFAGYPSVEYAQYDDAAMQLDVTIIDGFDVFKAFHEVFSFKEDDGGATCRVYRTQYLILADNGPVSWNDMEVEGKEELTALHKVFITSNEPSDSNGTGVDGSPTTQASQDRTTVRPTALPTLEPTTLQPTLMPSNHPSSVPTPTPLPTVKPTQFPPTNIPTVVVPPTQKPTLLPPTAPPTMQVLPTEMPIAPVPPPTRHPTAVTSVSPKETAEKEEAAVAPES